MFRLRIFYNKPNEETKLAGWLDFKTIQEANEYSNNLIESQHWGRNQRWCDFNDGGREDFALDTRIKIYVESSEEQIDQQGNIIPAVEEISRTEYLMPAEYYITIEDITEQVNKEAKIRSALSAQEKGAKIIARVWAINESKNLNAQDFAAIMNDATLQRIERLLWSGSLKTAKMLIQDYSNITDFFSQEEINEIVQMLE